MNIQKILYQSLLECEAVIAELARSEINPEAPAIYDSWAQEWSDFPFIVTSFATEYVQPHKTITRLELDLFTEHDQQRANRIVQELIGCLKHKKLFDTDGSYYRFYYENDSEVMNINDSVTQWNVVFTVICWQSI